MNQFSMKSPLAPGVWKPNGQVRMVVRALDILEFFRSTDAAARASEVADALDLPRSSAIEVLQTLVDTGYLFFDTRSKRYFPSLRLVSYGAWLADKYDGIAAVIQVMRQLNLAIGSAFGLGVRSGPYVQFFYQIGYSDYLNEKAASSAITPVLGSASGTATIIELRRVEVEGLIRQWLHFRPTEDILSQIESTWKHVELARRKGFATTLQPDLFPDGWGVAVPIQDPSRRSSFVVTTGGLKIPPPWTIEQIGSEMAQKLGGMHITLSPIAGADARRPQSSP